MKYKSHPETFSSSFIKKVWLLSLFMFVLSACQLPQQEISVGHIQNRPTVTTKAPPIVKNILPPKLSTTDRQQLETYSVIVKDVDIRDLLFSLARDAKVNVDISPEIKGAVTINAVKQTLPQILERLSNNFDIAYEYINGGYRITPDKPVLRSYRIEYPNINRTSTSETRLNSLESAANAGASRTEVLTSSKNEFWNTLIQNIKDILQETDKEVIIRRKTSQNSQKLQKTDSGLNPTPEIKSKTDSVDQPTSTQTDSTEIKKLYASTVIANPEAGIMQVRGTFRQHVKVKEFLDLVLQSSRRQVLIEATVAEVQLSQKYEKGIDWKIFSNIAAANAGFITFGSGLKEATGLKALNDGGLNTVELGYKNTSGRNDFLGSLRLLEEFGNVKVLSSPKLSVLNNQTALLKVVDNYIYFTTGFTTTEATLTSNAKTTYSTNMISTPIGFVMSVTPFIGHDGMVQFNLRPSISRIIDFVKDPAPGLSGKTFNNLLPIVRSREIESIMRVADGNIAVLGGLMEDYISGELGGLPGITRMHGIGETLGNQNQERRKTELVIFIKPTIIYNPDINGDYQNFREYLFDNEGFQAVHPALGRQ